MNRIYQPLSLKSLKSSFDSGRFLAKQGDLIAVAFDTSDLSYLREVDKEDDALPDIDYR